MDDDHDVDGMLEKSKGAIKAIIPERSGYILLLVVDGQLGFASNMETESVCAVLAQALEREQGQIN